MSLNCDDVKNLEQLRQFIHLTLCAKENLLADQFSITEMELIRRGRPCGMQFSLQGPRSVRLGAVWAADHNIVYCYDAKGERYLKLRLKHRIAVPTQDAIRPAA